MSGLLQLLLSQCHIIDLPKMCKGIEERNRGEGSSLFCNQEAAAAVSHNDATSSLECCELCGSRASLYCQADDAFLCQKCDRWVHGANFLAFRHIRCMLCNKCQNLTQRYLIGASVEVVLPTLVSSRETRRHRNDDGDDDDAGKQSTTSLKMPFLFL